MKITKWIKGTGDRIPRQVSWEVVPTSTEDSRGYFLEGYAGKWLTVISTFSGDADKQILSINPNNNPSLAGYTEYTEEDALAEIEAYNAEQLQQALEEERLREIQDLTEAIEAESQAIADKQLILDSVKSGVLYGGNLELVRVLHHFTEASLAEDRVALDNMRIRLEELNGN